MRINFNRILRDAYIKRLILVGLYEYEWTDRN